MKVFNDLKTRGVADILIAVTDGLKGMPEALGAVSPATTLQTCIVHLMRNSLDYASWKDRKLLAAAIKPIYTAPSAEAAQTERLRARRLEPQVPHRRGRLAPRVGPRDSVLHVPAGGAPGDLHDQRDREHQRAAAQDHQDARSLPQRRRGHQADLAGAAQHHGRLGPRGPQRVAFCKRLEERSKSNGLVVFRRYLDYVRGLLSAPKLFKLPHHRTLTSPAAADDDASIPCFKNASVLWCLDEIASKACAVMFRRLFTQSVCSDDSVHWRHFSM
jgi:hypothetical protein